MPKAIRTARPYLLFIAAFITVTALLVGTTQSFSASSLKLISPNGGQSYAVGSSVKIKWAKGNGGSQVKVTLLKGGKGYLVITKKTKNDGKLTWKIPSKLKAGSNYKIKIQSLSNTKVSDTSNKPFKITKAKDTKTATFKITQPNGRKTYKTGKNMAIRWNKGTGTYVKITLLKGKTTTTIHKKTKNDGKYTYTIPATIKAGKNYKIKICSTTSTKSCATSKAFTIAKGTTSSTIKVTFPNKKEELEQGSTHVIKWAKGNGGKFVKIQLTRVKAGKDKGFRMLAKKTKNTGKFSWKIPATKKYPVGSKYKIKVMAFKGGAKINDLSDETFSIVKASSGGSTGGGSTGGGSTGGGKGGGNNDDPCVGEGADECHNPDIGGGDDDPNVGEGAGEETSITINSPAVGSEFVNGDLVTWSWTTTGPGADQDICELYSHPDTGVTTRRQSPSTGSFGPQEANEMWNRGPWTLEIRSSGTNAPCEDEPVVAVSRTFLIVDDTPECIPGLCVSGYDWTQEKQNACDETCTVLGGTLEWGFDYVGLLCRNTAKSGHCTLLSCSCPTVQQSAISTKRQKPSGPGQGGAGTSSRAKKQ